MNYTRTKKYLFLNTACSHKNAEDLHKGFINKYLASVILLLFCVSSGVFGQKLTGVEKYDTTLLAYHSPKKASLYSAVLPGLGQIYNKKYWKVPILYAGAGALIYFIDFNNTKYLKYKSLYIKKLANDPSDLPELAQRLDEGQLKGQIDYWSTNRDYCIIGLAVLYLANVFDATVDAYLFDYEVSQDLSMHIQPILINPGYSNNFGLSLALRF